jgi:thiamine-phosphate pyrophosphorylase
MPSAAPQGSMHGVYAICDTKHLASRGVDPIAYSRIMLEVRPAALQLRAKEESAREVLNLLRLLRPMCRHAGVPLVANDRPDLAVLAGCEMVHLGQLDASFDLVQRIAPGLTVGLSTHNLEQLGRALALHPRYVAYGPVFATSTKDNAGPVVGLEGLRAASAMARSARIPLVAIGGITLVRAREVGELADAAAVIADLCPLGATLRDVGERARAFQSALRLASPPPGEASS